MGKNRLEAFSDGVIAIIITIMVLELKIPRGQNIEDLFPLLPVFLSYLLSFIYVGIYWNNHHHMLNTVHKVNGPILWANMHLLFWPSLFPFATAWMGEYNFAPWPTTLYGLVLLMAASAYFILQNCIIRFEGANSKLKLAIGKDWKEKASLICYAISVCLALIWTWLAHILFIAVAIMWLMPDRRIEKVLSSNDHNPD